MKARRKTIHEMKTLRRSVHEMNEHMRKYVDRYNENLSLLGLTGRVYIASANFDGDFTESEMRTFTQSMRILDPAKIIMEGKPVVYSSFFHDREYTHLDISVGVGVFDIYSPRSAKKIHTQFILYGSTSYELYMLDMMIRGELMDADKLRNILDIYKATFKPGDFVNGLDDPDATLI